MTTAFTTHNRIMLPSIEIQELNDRYHYVPLRGFHYCLAVYEGNNCCGWVAITLLGYHSVSEWMTQTKWIDEGY